MRRLKGLSSGWNLVRGSPNQSFGTGKLFAGIQNSIAEDPSATFLVFLGPFKFWCLTLLLLTGGEAVRFGRRFRPFGLCFPLELSQKSLGRAC
jgi:hypothetical protein